MPTTLPLAVVPSARTTGLNFLKYDHFLTSGVRFASWPLSPRVRASVNGTVSTIGSVPAASFAAKVEPSHWYSTGFTLMVGLAFWKAAICSSSCAFASFVAPGIRPATVIDVVFLPDDCAAVTTESASSAVASTQSTNRVLRLFMKPVLPFVRRPHGGPSVADPHEQSCWV